MEIVNIKKAIGEYGKIILVGLLGTLILFSGLGIVFLVKEKELTVSLLDIGQGDAIFVRTPAGHTMLVDGGPNKKVLSEISKQGSLFTRELDVVVATHPDADHVTGLIPVLQSFNVGTIVTSYTKSDTGVFKNLEEEIEKENASHIVASKGDVIDFHDGVKAYILYPRDTKIQDTNDSSVSMIIVYGEESFLLTGDLSSRYESDLFSDKLPRRVTVYKAGHHGSKYSSGEKLLSYIRPEYAVISAGSGNRYGHPNEETLNRLSIYAQETLSTIERGAITFSTDGHKFTVETEK